MNKTLASLLSSIIVIAVLFVIIIVIICSVKDMTFTQVIAMIMDWVKTWAK